VDCAVLPLMLQLEDLHWADDASLDFIEQLARVGRELPLLIVALGRWQHEVVVTRDERYIPITTLNTHNAAFDHVEAYQYYQDTVGELVVKIVPLPAYAEADTSRIQQALLTKLHGQMQIQVVFVPEIPRTRRGKQRMLIQELPVSFDHYYREDDHEL